jgi:hypothetical protein
LEKGQELISGAIAEQLGCISIVQSFNKPLWPIILTTSFDSLGHDLCKIAYVI